MVGESRSIRDATKRNAHSCSVVGGGAASCAHAGVADQENADEHCDMLTDICRHLSEENNNTQRRRSRSFSRDANTPMRRLRVRSMNEANNSSRRQQEKTNACVVEPF